ncbi:hypothetical protein [Otariodibacter sp.]|uniref:hypothetical protein n=1 Tax=Otariodibacter sp. TaxID=3030919 RepID=UPI0026314F7E|nr:hypothetical protein [Otariodibacter sp.]
MLFKKRSVVNVVNIDKPAFSMVEILISLAIGTLLIFSLSKFYSNIYIQYLKKNELLNIQKQTHQLLDYFQQHLQHIGYQGLFREKSNYSLFTDNGKPYSLNSPDCLIFLYDLDGDGCIGHRYKKRSCTTKVKNKTKDISKEIFGFKLKAKSIYIFEDDSMKNCRKDKCKQLLANCHKGKWRKLTALSDYAVEKLAFNWVDEGKLMKTELAIQSKKYKNIRYSAVIYSYIFNHINP